MKEILLLNNSKICEKLDQLNTCIRISYNFGTELNSIGTHFLNIYRPSTTGGWKKGDCYEIFYMFHCLATEGKIIKTFLFPRTLCKRK